MTDQIPAEAVEAARAASGAKGWEQARQIGVKPNTEARREENARERMRAALEAALPFLRPEPSEDDGSTWEQVRQDRGWPTPNAMRRAAASIDELAIPKYGDVLRFVADLCDDPRIPAGFTRHPMPSRDRLIGAIAGSECDWRDATPESIADAVLALFKGGEG